MRDAASWANAIARVPDAACHLVLGPKKTHTHTCKQRHLEAKNKPETATDDYTKPHVHCPSDVFAQPNKALNPARVESSSKRTAKVPEQRPGCNPERGANMSNHAAECDAIIQGAMSLQSHAAPSDQALKFRAAAEIGKPDGLNQ